MSNISYDLAGKYGINKQVLLSKEDYDVIKGKSLCCISSGYVMIWADGKSQYLHRWIHKLEKGDKRVVDHVDGDKLNCTRENLRICTTSENMQNREKNVIGLSSTSKYKGVYHKGNSWSATCRKDNVSYYLGSFRTEIEAAEAYNKKTSELYTSFATLNIIKE